MNERFSESSRLLIENWDMVQEIHEAEATLATEFRDYLFSFEQKLAEKPWWDDQWVFERYQNSQVFIARREWKIGDDYAIWIGLQQFTPEALFGTDQLASLYVWVIGNAAALVSPLQDIIAGQQDIAGELGSMQSHYVVKAALRKCLPEEIDSFDEMYGAPIRKFFDCYGRLHPEFTAAFREARDRELPPNERIQRTPAPRTLD